MEVVGEHRPNKGFAVHWGACREEVIQRKQTKVGGWRAQCRRADSNKYVSQGREIKRQYAFVTVCIKTITL